MAEPIHQQFTKINEAIQSESWETVISLSDRILKQHPQDKEALACKIAALIKHDHLTEALSAINAAQDKDAFRYEQAYALYKEKNPKALDFLQDCPKEEKYYVLKAQINYILERFQDACRLYEEMEALGGYHTDLLCNLIATHVRLDDAVGVRRLLDKYQTMINGSFECIYNVGTGFLESGDLKKAREYLEISRKLCETSLQENGFEADVIAGEAGIIKAQLAYIEQRKGETAVALKLFEEIFESKTGLAVKAVCSNNIVTLREGDKFDSLRKLQKLRNDAVQSRLAPMQLQIIGFNHCLLLHNMNKSEECKQLLDSLTHSYPNNDLYPILSSAILQKEKKIEESQALLNNFIAKHPEIAVNSSLVLAQQHINRGEVIPAIKILTGIEKLKNKPAMVCTIVSLLKQIGDFDGAIRVLDEMVKASNEKDGYYLTILRGNADLKMELGRFAEAAVVYKKLLSLDNKNEEVMLLLAMAFAQSDVEKARDLEKQLPSIGDVDALNAEDLEKLPVILPSIVTTKSSEAEKAVSTAKPEPEKKPKKKKKKKNKPPKNLNPQAKPDPDRWKPKHMRAGYRGKKKGKVANSKGVQGSAVVSQAQQLAEQGIKGAQPLKNQQPVQPQQPVDKGPTPAQRKAQAAAQAATKPSQRGGKGGGGGGKRGGKK